MYQRSAKMSKPAGDDRISPMTLMQFVRECSVQLNDAGYEDCAFYFDQIVDHIRSGKGLTSDPKKVSSILGL
jgi:hypothetical protein